MSVGLAFAIAMIIMVIGVLGTVIPGLPGLPLVWLGALVFFIGTGIDADNIAFFAVITVIAVVGTVLAYVLPGQRSHAAGASWGSVALGAVGAIIGTIVFSIPGAILGGIGGVYLGERLRNAGHDAAWTATFATLKGMGWGFLLQFLSSVLVFAIFIPWAFIEF